MVPHIYVSQMKWSFLHNGAIRCHPTVYSSISRTDWVLIKCLNTPTGRFVSLIVPEDTDNLKTFFSSMRQIEFLTTEGQYLYFCCH